MNIDNIMALADDYGHWREQKTEGHRVTIEARNALRAAIEQALAAQPKQEPARDMPHGWVTNWPSPDGGTKPVYHASAIKPKYGAELDEKPTMYPVYTHPQPKAEPLTDEQIQAIWNTASGTVPGWSRHIAYARAIEAAHGIK